MALVRRMLGAVFGSSWRVWSLGGEVELLGGKGFEMALGSEIGFCFGVPSMVIMSIGLSSQEVPI